MKILLKTVAKHTTESYRERGSKFIGHLFPAGSIDIFENQLKHIRSKYPDATHHCYAYRINPNDLQEFSQDDGEPGGTAGLPILNKLRFFEMVNVAVIVARYFGGTKLGKSGLIGAYGLTTQLCLEKAELSEVVRTWNFKVSYPYNRQNQIDRLIATYGLIEIDAEYLEEVSLTLACPSALSEGIVKEFKQLKHLGIHYHKIGEDILTK